MVLAMPGEAPPGGSVGGAGLRSVVAFLAVLMYNRV